MYQMLYPFHAGVRLHHLTITVELRDTELFKALPN